MTIDFSKGEGLVPAIVQDDANGDVLMIGYMNQEALRRTQETKRATFWSRSRGELWEKGETSGNTLHVVSIAADCDGDALLIRARPDGPVCHTGQRSCFGDASFFSATTLRHLEHIVADRKAHPREGSWTTRLFERGLSRIAQKVGEEAVETVLAASVQNRKETISESADLLYHLTVLFAASGIRWQEVEKELQGRMKDGEK